jgi:surfeit locus 1 family protein
MHFRPLPVLSTVTLVALAILVGLGLWQLDRRDQKHALRDEMQRRMIAPAVAIESLLVDDAHVAFRHATAQGAFDHTQESYVFSPRSDPAGTRLGYKVVTPLRLTANAVVMVDRGWVPEEKRAPATRLKGQIEGPLSLRGVLRPATAPGVFTPHPNLVEHIWYVHDIGAMAAAHGLAPATLLYLEASAPVSGGPEPKLDAPDIADNHLQYALTWFGLGIALVVIYLVYHRSRGRLRFR